MKHGKHYVDAAKLVDSTKAYDVNEALELACKTASAMFDETVELPPAMRKRRRFRHLVRKTLEMENQASEIFAQPATSPAFA